MSRKRLSRHDDRPGSMLGLVFLWDLVPAVHDYLESEADLSPGDWDALAGQVGVDVDVDRGREIRFIRRARPSARPQRELPVGSPDRDRPDAPARS